MNASGRSIFKPVIFNPKRSKDRAVFSRLLRAQKHITVVDDWEEEYRELGFVQNPKRITRAALFSRAAPVSRNDTRKGVWVYYPWRNALVRVLEKNFFHKVRVSRNFNLILPAEQKKFEQARIGIAGLNVGNSAAVCIALEGGGQEMILADNDILSVSNLNRFRAGLPDLGLNKAVVSARQVYEINPFARITVLERGIEAGKEDIFLTKPRVDILVEEMDNMKLKISIREAAKHRRIPVVMVTGNGPNVIIDIERFDQNPRLPLLNGYLKPGIIRQVKALEPGKGILRERILLARDFMGARHLVERLRRSFDIVGTRLVGIPQIAESSFLRGAVVCYVVRQIAIGARVPSGRYHLRLDTLIK